jgi:alpha-tubulin suppressor-like RCC1 family protein
VPFPRIWKQTFSTKQISFHRAKVVWGQNKHGQCGVRIPGEVEALKRPLFVPGLLTHRVVSAACGGGHTLVVTEGGKVLSWGTGQLGGRLKCPENSNSCHRRSKHEYHLFIVSLNAAEQHTPQGSAGTHLN